MKDLFKESKNYCQACEGFKNRVGCTFECHHGRGHFKWLPICADCFGKVDPEIIEEMKAKIRTEIYTLHRCDCYMAESL